MRIHLDVPASRINALLSSTCQNKKMRLSQNMGGTIATAACNSATQQNTWDNTLSDRISNSSRPRSRPENFRSGSRRCMVQSQFFTTLYRKRGKDCQNNTRTYPTHLSKCVQMLPAALQQPSSSSEHEATSSCSRPQTPPLSRLTDTAPAQADRERSRAEKPHTPGRGIDSHRRIPLRLERSASQQRPGPHRRGPVGGKKASTP
jgi:hypothetical protein